MYVLSTATAQFHYRQVEKRLNHYASDVNPMSLNLPDLEKQSQCIGDPKCVYTVESNDPYTDTVYFRDIYLVE